MMRGACLCGALAIAACADERTTATFDGQGPDPDGGAPDAFDPTEALFEPDHLVHVEIELGESDWDELRVQTRSLFDILGGDCLGQPFPKPFTYFEGTVTVDGNRVESVGVRKKGFLGSLDDEKPSLKIKFDEYVPGQRFLGLSRLTLNNARQDPSYARQCLTYEFFTEAGLPASRCNFARVSVNGKDKGLYVNVESVDKRFLARHFGSNDGNLYEGTLSDFRDGWMDTFERKTNEADLDRSDLDLVADALQVEDADLAAALDEVIDLDQFFTFWAAEVITAHWDGYAGNTNNFYIYRDPTAPRFQFLPWGVDATFQNPQGPAVLGQGFLARRLYENPSTRREYLDRLRELLDEVWDERALFDAVDRMEYVIRDVTRDAEGPLEELRGFVMERGDWLHDQLESTPTIEGPLRDPPCLEPIGTISATFATTWGTLGAGDPFNTGSATMNVTLADQTPSFAALGATAGLDPNPQPGAPPRALVQIFGYVDDGNMVREDDTILLAILAIDTSVFTPGEVALDLGAAYGVLIAATFPFQESRAVALIAPGTATFDEASTVSDAPVQGSLDSTLVLFPF